MLQSIKKVELVEDQSKAFIKISTSNQTVACEIYDSLNATLQSLGHFDEAEASFFVPYEKNAIQLVGDTVILTSKNMPQMLNILFSESIINFSQYQALLEQSEGKELPLSAKNSSSSSSSTFQTGIFSGTGLPVSVPLMEGDGEQRMVKKLY